MPDTFATKIAALREKMSLHDINGYLVPQTDEYQNEFVPACYQRLAWLTGFTGSAGIAVILENTAVVLTDGRYTIQVRDEVDNALYDTADSTKISAIGWIKEHAQETNLKIGYDPSLFTYDQIEKFKKDTADTSIKLIPITENLVDQIWQNRPEKPRSAIEVFPHEIAGLSVNQKIEKITEVIKDQNADACFLPAPESVCWLLNIRGNDTPCTPLVLSEVLVRADGSAVWFIDETRITDAIRTHTGDHVEIVSPGDKSHFNDRILLDLKRSSLSWKLQFEDTGCTVINAKDPCINLRARKTATEIDSIKRTHIADGIAITKLLHWIDEKQSTGITELDVSAKIAEFRGQHNAYRGESFNCIAGMGSNGAIIHYRPSEKTNKAIEGNGLLLVDSGGQYAHGNTYGTTDITRTVAIGAPTDEMREMYTRVLKGHIAVASAIFPKGTVGKDIDALARASLREVGADFMHGTGHGVGCYLSVHEEAASLSWLGEAPLEIGMLLSNEPGYYKEGKYGIRLENLVLVVEKEEDMLGFETVSFAPFDERLIDRGLLNEEEGAWLDDYHDEVSRKVSSAIT